ncbi:hypothetical protein JCM31826_17950 [Thermaurantimonas aggregans]|uniref:Lipoprotein n=1 Tax=Thermaurantimonas aggregans TaxID=2173829 RepID=A0A401XMU0_9FLAO|nr:hypothetical protein [Thermaurantimonas aggregans]MCX8149392.1 hypothetical protein [Thermaurantimonas aggregans]GCD78313.1 hypothetical protein JCM31826_17950 [Thermaurantimonas aggregans]
MINLFHKISLPGCISILAFLLLFSCKTQKKQPNFEFDFEVTLGNFLFEDLRIQGITNDGVLILNRKTKNICLHTKDSIKNCVDLKKLTDYRKFGEISYVDTCNYIVYIEDSLTFREFIYIKFVKDCNPIEFRIDYTGHLDAVYFPRGFRNFNNHIIVFERLPQEIDTLKVKKVSILDLRDHQGSLLNSFVIDSRVKQNTEYLSISLDLNDDKVYFAIDGKDTIYCMTSKKIEPIFYKSFPGYNANWLAYDAKTNSILRNYTIWDKKSEHYMKKVLLVYNLDKKSYYYIPVPKKFEQFLFQAKDGKIYYYTIDNEKNTIRFYAHTIRS